jgi:hypothetical protein
LAVAGKKRFSKRNAPNMAENSMELNKAEAKVNGPKALQRNPNCQLQPTGFLVR